MDEKQIRKYFNQQVNPIFEQLIVRLARYRPQDIIQFCIKWFRDRGIKDDNESDDDEDKFEEISDEQFRVWKNSKLEGKRMRRRQGVSAEVYGPNSVRKQIHIKNGEKKPQKTHLRILFFLSNSFVFKYFNEEEKNALIESMSEKLTSEGEVVVKEGEVGDTMYIVDEGQYECYKNTLFDGQLNVKLRKVYGVGDTFGELVLLHGQKRRATIICNKGGRLYTLTRQVYRHFKKLSLIRRKVMYFDTLKKVKLFQNFSNDEFEKICDVLVEVNYEAGQMVIIEGDIGNKFYIILEGVLVALKGPQQRIIQCYKDKDYFGELALLNDAPRQASVKSLTKAKLMYLTQNVFKRIFNKVSFDVSIDEKYRRKPVLIKKRNQF